MKAKASSAGLLVAAAHWLVLSGCRDSLEYSQRDAAYAQYEQELAEQLYTFGGEPSVPLTQSLDTVRGYLQAHYRPYAEALQPPLSREQIELLLDRAGLDAPEEVYALYSWSNGQRILPGQDEPQFIVGYRFLPLEEAIGEYQSWSTQPVELLSSELWGRSRLPILGFQDSHIAVACAGERKGTVYDLLLESPEPSAAYQSLSAFMEEQAAYCEERAYYVNDEGLFSSDETKLAEIFARYHPRLETGLVFVERSRREEALDNGGKMVHIEFADAAREQVFDARGRLFSQTDVRQGRPFQKFTNTYDEAGRLRSRQHDNGVTIRWIYDEHSAVTIERTYPHMIEVLRGKIAVNGYPSIQTVERRSR